MLQLIQMASNAFQRFINEVLRDLMDICMVGYLDDILIYSDSLEDHQDHVCEVLHHLHMAGLYANLKKCKFHTDTVEYLRFILSPKGLQMDPTKVSMIQDWPEPQKVRDVQAFLGFANFCHAPSWLAPGGLSHMHIHLTTDRDLTQLNALPCVGNAEYSLTQTSPGRQGQCVDSTHAIFIHLAYNTLCFM